MFWFLREDLVHAIERARKDFVPTAEQLAEFHRVEEAAASDGMPRNLRIAGSEAEIIVEGPLSKRREIFYSYYWSSGYCTYNDIIASLALAESDPNVKRVILKCDSPGGTCDGLMEAILAIEAFSKPIIARGPQALSACYALAAACDRIEALNQASVFGCLGVATTYLVWDDEITLTNTESPEKRPDPRTPEGKQSIVRYLDSINEWFSEAIARGRKRAGKDVTAKDVNADYGRGATLMAPDAKKRGMIDGFVAQRQPAGGRAARAENDPEHGAPESGAQQPGQENDTMNKKLLAQALGLSESASDEAFEAGVVALGERARAVEASQKQTETVQKAAEAQLKQSQDDFKAYRDKVEGKLGVTGDAAFGAIDGLLAAKKDLDAARTQLAEQAKAADDSKRTQLEKQGSDEGKLNPALIAHYKDKPVAELEGFLKVAPRIVPTPVRQPGAKTEGGSGSTEPKTAGLTWKGKAYAELKPAQRAELKREDKELFDAMRAENEAA